MSIVTIDSTKNKYQGDNKMSDNFYKDGRPDGWYLNSHTGYSVVVETEAKEESGKHPVFIESIGENADYQPITLSLKHNYVGEKITLSAYIKTENVSDNGFVGLWMNINPAITAENMQEKDLKGTNDWTKHEITLDMNPAKTTGISFGGLIVGQGKVWFDDLKVTIDGKDLSEVETIDFYDNTQELLEKSKIMRERAVQQRALLKASAFDEMSEYWNATDQCRNIKPPAVQKDYDGEIIKLATISQSEIGSTSQSEIGATISKKNIYECIQNRRSRRKFTDEKITLNELSFLLWSTQGVQRKMQEGRATIRTVPSGGARHPFETYLAVFNVGGLEQGLYRYLPLEHALTFLYNDALLKSKLIEAASGQPFAGETGVTFIWTAIPYRTEWRYSFASAKTILLDCGHVCQNLYLACEALKLGTCAIAAYDQEKIDELLKLDGQEEMAVYMAPVGRY